MEDEEIKGIEKQINALREAQIPCWEKIIELKIKIAKNRAYRKRGWIKLDKNWLTSSMNYRLTLEEQAAFSKVLVMADEFGPVPGLISDNDFRPMPHKYLAHQACCNIEIFETMLKKCYEDDSIFENSHGIFVTHFDDYQFTEYDRQKPYRQAKKEQESGPRRHTFKVCPECSYKARTSESYCPECEKSGKDTRLNTDYTAGEYGHMVQR